MIISGWPNSTGCAFSTRICVRVPAFGALYYDPAKDNSTHPIHDQLETLGRLVKQGKIRAIGLSNETPYGVHEFIQEFIADNSRLGEIITKQYLI